MFKFLLTLKMAYSETKVIIGALAHVPILIFIANLIKGKFETKEVKNKETKIKNEPILVIEEKESKIIKEEVKVIEKLSNRLEEIEKKAKEVNKDINKKKKKKDMKRD